jgi:hypothetical protein
VARPGTPVPYNANFILLAENLSFLPGLKQGEDYLNMAKPTHCPETGTRAVIVSRLKGKKIGGQKDRSPENGGLTEMDSFLLPSDLSADASNRGFRLPCLER